MNGNKNWFILLIKIRNITILYNYYIIKIIFYIRVIFFLKLNERIQRLMRKRIKRCERRTSNIKLAKMKCINTILVGI